MIAFILESLGIASAWRWFTWEAPYTRFGFWLRFVCNLPCNFIADLLTDPTFDPHGNVERDEK